MGGAGEQERSWVAVVCVGSCPRSVWRSPPCRGYRARARSRQEAAAAEARCEAEADINPIYNPKASFGRELAGRHRARADEPGPVRLPPAPLPPPPPPPPPVPAPAADARFSGGSVRVVMGAAASGALLALSPAALSGAWLAAAAGASAVALSPMAGLLARRGKTMGSGAACADGTAGGGATDQVTRPRGLVAIVARATVPHEWFVHFYVVGVVACVTAAYGVALVTDGGTAAARAAVPLALFSCHVVRRLAEEIATNSATGPRASRMHVAGYMTGLGYYAMAPATYACVAVTARDRSGAGTPSSAALCFCAGLFAYASLQHARAHAALRAWRAARPHQYTQPSSTSAARTTPPRCSSTRPSRAPAGRRVSALAPHGPYCCGWRPT